MRNEPVHWSEGLFLRPHHFQAAEQYWTESVQTSEQWDHPYYYGLQELDYSREAIANSSFQINRCQARLRDGTLVSLETGQEPDRADLKEALAELEAAPPAIQTDLTAGFEAEPVLRIYLAVPKLKMGAANVASDSEPGQHRYRENRRSLQDESRGGNDQEIALKSLNVRLLLSTQDMSGYEVLPIAQIQRSGALGAAPELDVRYIPPLLSVECWPPLGRDIVRAIYDLIGAKIEVLTQQVLSRGMTLASQEPGDLDRIFMLSRLNEAYATLGVLAFASGLHPFVAYYELCRIVGQLSIFAVLRRAPEVPRYDHDDLARIFTWVYEQIKALLNAIQDYEYEQQNFIGVGLGMQVTLKPKWLNTDWKWYVGVAHENISDVECRELLGQGQLDWKLGSQRQVEALFTMGRPGLDLLTLNVTPDALPRNRAWNFYEVTRQNEAWKDVQVTQTLAMRLRDNLIRNRNELQGQHKLVVGFRGKQAILEFALFAVRMRTS